MTDKVVPVAQQAVPKAPIPTDPATLVRINAGAQILAAAALATGRAPRLSATVLAASLVPTTLAGHAFWDETDPQAKNAQQRCSFYKNTSVLGGLLLAGVDTEGKPGLAWRARRVAAGRAPRGRRTSPRTPAARPGSPRPSCTPDLDRVRG